MLPPKGRWAARVVRQQPAKRADGPPPRGRRYLARVPLCRFVPSINSTLRHWRQRKRAPRWRRCRPGAPHRWSVTPANAHHSLRLIAAPAAAVSLRARDRKGLLRLIRYGARPCFSQDRLSELPDGRIRYRLSRPWAKQRAIALQPTSLLHRLAALIRAPYVDLTRDHGCCAPNASRRHEVINLAFRNQARARRRPSGDRAAVERDDGLLHPLPAPPPVERSIPWADLLQRTFEVDVLECPTCQGRLSIIAFITDVIVVGKLLAHLRLAIASEPPRPSRREEQLGLDFDIATDYSPPLTVIGDQSCRGPPA